MESQYCYPNTKVLVNKQGIDSAEKLEKAERALVSLRIAELHEKPIKGSFDLKHLSKIHLHLFQDVYSWAGKTRNCFLVKGNVEFCLPQHIYYYADSIFAPLRNERFYLSLENDEKIEKLARLFGDINALHPFREGNGRTQRIFIEWVSLVSGISLDLTRVTNEEMTNASIDSMHNQYNRLIDIFMHNSHFISEEVRKVKIKSLINDKKLLQEVMKR